MGIKNVFNYKNDYAYNCWKASSISVSLSLLTASIFKYLYG